MSNDPRFDVDPITLSTSKVQAPIQQNAEEISQNSVEHAIPEAESSVNSGTIEIFSGPLDSAEPSLISSHLNLQMVPFNGGYIEIRNHPLDKVIGNIASGVMTRQQLSNFCLNAIFISQLEPKKYQEALRD